MKRFVSFLIITVFLFGTVCFGQAYVSSADDEIKTYRVLCISSYNYSFSTVPDQLNGLSDGLHNISCDITYEFMDSKNYYRSEDINEFYTYLKYKLDNAKPYDLIVLADDTALHFGLNNADTLFPDTPIIFMGVNNLTDAETAAARQNISGVAEVVDFKSNAKLFSDLFPDRENLAIVLDNSNTAQGEYVEFEKFAEENGIENYDIINASYYSQNGLIEAFKNLDETYTVVFLDILSDGEGNTYNIETATTLLHENAPDVPITRVSLADAGYGILGGVSYSYYDAGLAAGEMAADVLTGKEKIEDIDLITDAVTVTYFHQDEMDEFGISPSDLPDDAVIIDQHQTFALFYKEHTAMMNLIFLVIVLMAVIIIFLFISNRRRQELIHQDFMTKIPNRTYITKHLREVTEQGEPFGLIMMDVDHFKSINDTLGHLIGDELLIEVASRLKNLPQEDVIFARIGGDEFMGFITRPTIDKADGICQSVTDVMHKDFDLSCGPINITVSLGAALYPIHTDNPGKVQGLADLALYNVKEAGRDGYRIYDETMSKDENTDTKEKKE